MLFSDWRTTERASWVTDGSPRDSHMAAAALDPNRDLSSTTALSVEVGKLPG